jgi:hypothetical protein
MPLNVFVSYSHSDESLYDRLAKHLRPLEREGLIRPWHDRRIVAGSEFDVEIKQELESADIILLLISSDFMASEYCCGIELKRAMERYEERSAHVVPVILRAVDWRTAPFGKLSALPRGGRPVTAWPDIDEAFLNITKAIRLLVSPKAAPPYSWGKDTHHSADAGASGDSYLSLTFVSKYKMSIVSSNVVFDIVIDGDKKSGISIKETIELSLPAGYHRIQIKRMWLASKEISFTTAPSEKVTLECEVDMFNTSRSIIERMLLPGSFAINLRRIS